MNTKRINMKSTNLTVNKCANTVHRATYRRLLGLPTVAALLIVATQSFPLGANTKDTADASDEFTFVSSIEGNGPPNESLDPIERVKAELEEGDPNDFLLRYRLGIAYQNEGMHEEALEEFLWCLDDGPKYKINESWSGPPSRSVLANISELAKIYPPAMDVLVKRRDSLFKTIQSNETEYQLNTKEIALDFGIFVALLGDDDYTLSVLKQLEDDQTADHAKTLEIFATVNLDTLDQHGMFEVIAKYVNIRRQIDFNVSLYTRPGERHPDDSMRSFVQGRLSTFYKILLATNRPEDADYAAEQTIGLFDDAEIHNALALAAIESNNPSEENVDQAREAVELDASNARYVDTLIQLLHSTGSTNEAVETGRKFLNTDPSTRDAALIENTLERIQ